MMQRLRGLVLLLLITGSFLAGAAQAESAPDFPELTGRVVDNAGMLDPQTEAVISGMSEAHEQASGEQLVVVTVPNLQGYPIEDYGYQLGRHWGIGQKGEDNGALLLISEEDRKIRIEVGYGLEGRLTDAQSSAIINGIITPAFRQGDFAGGIRAGTAAMIQVLGGEPLAQPAPRRGVAQTGDKPSVSLASLFFLIMMAVVYFLGGGGGRGRRRGRGGAAFLGGALLGAGLGRGGGGFGGGGFGGGGGGFGGGGASGGW